MNLQLRIVEDQKNGRGIIEIIEDKSPMIKAIIGYISFDDESKKKFFIDALLKGRKFGEVVSA